MGIFQRLKQAMSTRLEPLVDDIENRESVALATVQEMEREVARVRLQRKRLDRRAGRLEQRACDLESAMNAWRERARRDTDDRAKAIEDVRRLVESERRHAATLEEMFRAKALRDKLREDERVLDGKLDELRQRCVALSTRESHVSIRLGLDGSESVDQAFDRWEARIEEREALAEAAAHAAGVYDSEDEEAAELERRLEDILAEGGRS